MAARTWAMGETFTMADCAAAPALFYADKVMPFGATHPNTTAYLGRLDAAPVLCARARGGEALFRDVPRLARPAQSALSARVATG